MIESGLFEVSHRRIISCACEPPSLSVVLLAGVSAAAQAQPEIHAHRGGGRRRQTQVRRGDPRRLSQRGQARLRLRGRHQAHHRRRPGGNPRRHSRPHHHLHRRGAAQLHAPGFAPAAPTSSAARRRTRHPYGQPARLDPDRRGAELARLTGSKINLEIERAHGSRLGPDLRVRRPGHGRRQGRRAEALPDPDPELHRGQPRRGEAKPRGVEPACSPSRQARPRWRLP